MKLISILPALAGFLVLTACDTPSPSLLSIDSVTTEKDTAADPSLSGTWVDADEKATLCIIRPADKSGYDILFIGGNTPTSFHAQLFRIDKTEFLDVTPGDDDDFRVSGHAIARIWNSGTRLRWGFLDSDWFKQQAAPLANHSTEGKMLLLAPPASVRAFIEANGLDEKAYGKTVTWQRSM